MRKIEKITGMLFVLFVLLWADAEIGFHTKDFRLFTADTAQMLAPTLDLVDEGVWPLVGNPVFGRFRLGPLTDYLAALPLVLTRNPEWHYYFLSLLTALAVFLFYRALRRLDERPLVRWIGAACFATGLHAQLAPQTLSNKSYLPLFLALAFYFFVRADDDERYWPAVGGAIGLCMQCHFSCLLLLPTAWIAARPFASTRRLLLNLAGLSLVLLIHAPAIYYHLVLLPAAPTAKAAGALKPVVSLLGTLPPTAGNLCRLTLPALLAAGAWVLFAFAGAGLHLGRAALVSEDRKRFAQAGIFQIGATLLLAPLTLFFKPTPLQGDYFLASLPFYAWFAGLFGHWLAERTWSRPVRRWLRRGLGAAFVILLIVPQTTLMGPRIRPRPVFFDAMRLDSVTAVAKQALQEAQTRKLTDFRTLTTCLAIESGRDLTAFTREAHTFAVLFRLLDPEWYAATHGETHALIVQLAPAMEEAVWPAVDPETVILDRWDAANLTARLVWHEQGGDMPLFFNPRYQLWPRE